MMWLCRPGKHGSDFEDVKKYRDIFLGWDGYRLDLQPFKSRDDFKKLVIEEKNPEARTTISNWAGQLYSFCIDMKIDDYVLIPNRNAKEFLLAKIDGSYRYEPNRKYPHVRKIAIVREGILRSAFSQSSQYSLGAFRTVFKVKQEEEVLKVAGLLR
jgi:conserved domain protein